MKKKEREFGGGAELCSPWKPFDARAVPCGLRYPQVL
jgi:hypothetical protein